MKSAFLFLSLLAVAAAGRAAEVRWADGSVAPAPEGALLSDNYGFYGETELTGAVYRYRNGVVPGSGDSAEDASRQRGRRLQNGDIGNQNFVFTDLNSPRLPQPAEVEFDFQRPCTFREVDLHLAPGTYRLTLQAGDTPEELSTVFADRGFTVSDARSLARFPLETPVRARYLLFGLSDDNGEAIALSEVYAWGERGEAPPEGGGRPPFQVYDISYLQSVPGITNTTVDEGEFKRWQRQLERTFGGRPGLVWAEVPAWEPLTKEMFLPSADAVGRPVELTLVRNETEAAALVLVNTDFDRGFTGEVSVSAFTDAAGAPAAGLAAELCALAAMPSRDFGVQLTTLISEANKPAGDVLRRYCANGEVIADFPLIRLDRAGSFFCWLKVTSDFCAPGEYTALLSAGGAEQQIRVTVLDAVLEDVPRFVNYWWKPFGQYPFMPLDWTQRDAEHRLEIGTTVLPERCLAGPGSLGEIMRAAQPEMLFGFWQGEFGGHVWAAGHMDSDWGKVPLTAEQTAKIESDARGIAAYARSKGLDFDHWFYDMADEPNARNYRFFGEVAAVMHRAVPEAMISCNPCSWMPQPPYFEPDGEIYPLMKEWYNDAVQISLPAVSLVDYPLSGTLFKAPRRFNAFYEVVTSRAKSESRENVNYPRMLAWEAIRLGFNGWNMYSYFDVNGFEAWDDMAASEPSYALVYPGPNGPVPTRQFEAAREGYEDFLLMRLLAGRAPEAHAKILAALADGERYPELRDMIYEALR